MKKIVLPRIHINLERWKYNMSLNVWVSTDGRLMDDKRQIQPQGKSGGYMYYKGKAVHRIVMETWNPTPGCAFLTVDHKNRNCADNHLSNLTWMESKDNAAKAGEEDKANSPMAVLSNTSMFLVNGVPMSFETAQTTMRADPKLDKGANIARAFTNALTKDGVTEFGGYKIQRYNKTIDN